VNGRGRDGKETCAYWVAHPQTAGAGARHLVVASRRPGWLSGSWLLVVSPASADTRCDNVPFAIDLDHSMIAKPRDDQNEAAQACSVGGLRHRVLEGIQVEGDGLMEHGRDRYTGATDPMPLG
jgi:hypothetical protein